MKIDKKTTKYVCQACFSFIEGNKKKSLCHACEKKYKNNVKV